MSWLRVWTLVFVATKLFGDVNAATSGRFQFAQALYTTTEDFGVAYLTVQRNLGCDGRAAVYVSTVPGVGSAVPGRDFRPLLNVSLVWQDGDDFEKALYIPIYNDGKPQESPKNFTLCLHDAIGAEINPDRNQTQVVLAPPSNLHPGSFSFETDAVSIAEGNTLTIPVLWVAGTTSTASVQFNVICNTACWPGDFMLVSPIPQLLTWKRDDYTDTSQAREKDIVLSIISDHLYEQTETFAIQLSLVEPVDGAAISTGAIGDTGEIVVTIPGPNDVQPGTLQFDADCFPGCASTNYSVTAGGSAAVIVQRRSGSDENVSVSVVTQDGTAIGGVDYVAFEKILAWEEGDTSDRTVIISTLPRADPRLPSRRFSLVLQDNQSAPIAGVHASETYVDIATPTDVYLGDVNFAGREPLESILQFPDLSFISLASRNTSSRLQLCPRVVVRKPEVLSVAIQRNFEDFPVSAQATVTTVEGTAKGGVDFEALTNTIVTWADGDTQVKNVYLTLLTPPTFDPYPRSLWLELSDVSGATIGDCNILEVVLIGMAPGPRVLSFGLDMSAGTITLQMSVPVQAATLDVAKLLLQAESQLMNGPIFTFSAQSTSTSSADGSTIVLNIGSSDLNALKRVSGLTTTAVSTFLSTSAGLFRYVLNNCKSTGIRACMPRPTIATPSSAALAVSTFTADTFAPTLLSYSFDLSRRFIKLHFSEAVDFATLRIESLSLSETAAGVDTIALSSATARIYSPQPDPLSGAPLNDGNRLPADYTYLTLQISRADVAALAAFGAGQIGIQKASTFLGVQNTFITDFAGNPVLAVAPSHLLQVSAADCSACPTGTFLTSSCSDLRDRQCSPCSVCPTNSYAMVACKATQDTLCYPCTECRGGQFISADCTATTDRVCSACTQCALDEFEVSPCAAGVDRVCQTCNSCTLTTAQQFLCQRSPLWKRIQMRSPFSCPQPGQPYQSREQQLQRAQSNACGKGRCACVATHIAGNSNPNGDGFPNDPRCTGHDVYNIFV